MKRIKAKKNVLRGISSDLLIIIKKIKDFLDDKSNSVIRHITETSKEHLVLNMAIIA